jgi:hypothetical protein
MERLPQLLPSPHGGERRRSPHPRPSPPWGEGEIAAGVSAEKRRVELLILLIRQVAGHDFELPLWHGLPTVAADTIFLKVYGTNDVTRYGGTAERINGISEQLRNVGGFPGALEAESAHPALEGGELEAQQPGGRPSLLHTSLEVSP